MPHTMTKPHLSFFKNRSDTCLVARQVLSYTVHIVYKCQNSSKLALILTLCYRPDTHHLNPLYPCEIIMKQLCLIFCMTKTTCAYLQNHYPFVIFNSTEARTEALKNILCHDSILLVDTWLDLGLFRVVKQYSRTAASIIRNVNKNHPSLSIQSARKLPFL